MRRVGRWLKYLYRLRLGRLIARLLQRLDDLIDTIGAFAEAAKRIAGQLPEGSGQMQALARQAAHQVDLRRLKQLRDTLDNGGTISAADQAWINALLNGAGL